MLSYDAAKSVANNALGSWYKDYADGATEADGAEIRRSAFATSLEGGSTRTMRSVTINCWEREVEA